MALEYTEEKLNSLDKDTLMAVLEGIANKADTRYSERYFAQALSEYSQQSLTELIEELGAIYKNTDIANINKSLTAFNRTRFTRDEFAKYLSCCN